MSIQKHTVFVIQCDGQNHPDGKFPKLGAEGEDDPFFWGTPADALSEFEDTAGDWKYVRGMHYCPKCPPDEDTRKPGVQLIGSHGETSVEVDMHDNLIAPGDNGWAGQGGNADRIAGRITVNGMKAADEESGYDGPMPYNGYRVPATLRIPGTVY